MTTYLPLPSFFTIWTSAKEETSPTCSQTDEANRDQSKTAIDNIKSLLKQSSTSLKDLKQYQLQLKSFLQQEGDELLIDQDAFIADFAEWAIQQEFYQEAFSFLLDNIKLDRFNQLAKIKEGSFSSPEQLAKQYSHYYGGECSERNLKDQLTSEYKHYRFKVLYIMASMIDVFLGAFNPLDIYKRTRTLWDRYLAVEMIAKFVLMPSLVASLLEPILITPIKVYIVTAAIFVVFGVMAIVYQKWLHSLPLYTANCSNMREAPKASIQPIGISQIVYDSIEYLNMGINLMFRARSGSGKSLITQAVAEYEVEQNPHITWQKMDCKLVVGNLSFGYGEAITDTLDQIKGHEHQVRFVFDELDSLVAADKSCLPHFKQSFLGDSSTPSPKFLGTVTPEGFDVIKNQDSDYSFRRRVFLINIPDPTDEQSERISRNLAKSLNPHILITDDGIKAMVQCAKTVHAQVGMPAKLNAIVSVALAECAKLYRPKYIPPALIKAKEELEEMRQKAKESFDLPDVGMCKQINQKIDEVKSLENKDLEVKKHMRHMQLTMRNCCVLRDQHVKLTQKLAHSSVPNELETQKAFMFHQFYVRPLLTKSLNQAMEPLKNSNVEDWRIDEKFVAKIMPKLESMGFAEIKKE